MAIHHRLPTFACLSLVKAKSARIGNVNVTVESGGNGGFFRPNHAPLMCGQTKARLSKSPLDPSCSIEFVLVGMDNLHNIDGNVWPTGGQAMGMVSWWWDSGARAVYLY